MISSVHNRNGQDKSSLADYFTNILIDGSLIPVRYTSPRNLTTEVSSYKTIAIDCYIKQLCGAGMVQQYCYTFAAI